ncbi:hypothetical protein A9Q68_02540 [Streptococcus bovimastitidis]|uniref:DUF4440 domain-containing protein n=1 Tax=Streptococcus bovimastitidis TaxID=1856638 RepID=A0A1L8MNW6_9STRE|nr:nuclear transport factor 2 family protein [Streptococcus bovimastitidis]OJF72439.1 hypothetical protein A9Q68_02540 [Streptococcus bovimastitidis]
MTEMEDLIQLFKTCQQAMIDQNTEQIEKILSHEMQLIHMTGYLQSKEEWLSDIANGQMRYYSAKNKAIQELSLNEHQAQLTTLDYVRASIWGSPAQTWPLKTQVSFEKINGQWLISKQVASTF